MKTKKVKLSIDVYLNIDNYQSSSCRDDTLEVYREELVRSIINHIEGDIQENHTVDSDECEYPFNEIDFTVGFCEAKEII